MDEGLVRDAIKNQSQTGPLTQQSGTYLTNICLKIQQLFQEKTVKMPSELLHLPPLYAIVGLYRLATDPSIRTPVLDKVKHAAVRGVVVGSVYTVLSWKAMDWFIRKFLISGGWWKKGEEVLKDSVDGSVQVGLGKFSLNLNAVLCEFSESTVGDDWAMI